MADLGIGQQTSEYANQFNDLSALDDNPVALQRRANAKAQAQALAEKAEKAGAKAPEFKAAVKEDAKETPRPGKVSADNPFAKYATQKPVVSEGNPFAKYAQQAEADAAVEEPEEKPAEPLTNVRGESPEQQQGIRTPLQSNEPTIDPKKAFEDREAYGKELKAKGIAPATDEKYKEMVRQQGKSQTQNVEEAATYASPGGAGVAGAAPKIMGVAREAIAKPVAAVKGYVDTLTGKPAKEALDKVRGGIVGDVSKAASESEQAASTAAKKAESLQSQQNVARNLMNDRVTQLEKDYVAAGKSVEDAKKLAEQQRGGLESAEQFAKEWEEKTLANPKMDKKDFGDHLYKTVTEMEEKYVTQRAEESGYTKALDAAKDIKVDTTPVTQAMEDWAKITNTKGTDAVIDEVKSRMQSIVAGKEGDVAAAEQTVAKLNSFRKQIGDALRTKVFSDKAVDSETYKVLKAAKDAIDGVIDGATPDLTAAREKWAELSSPLDIMTGKGPLTKVLEVNPAGRDAAMAGAQVAGTIIQKANQGHEVFKRILEENPQIREDAKLYFTQELFGGGRVPSVNGLNDWLKKNRQALLQLDLYDDFSKIPRAKKTAEDAVAATSGTVKKSVADEKAALAKEKGVEKDRDTARTRRAQIDKRIGGAKEEAQKVKVTAEDAARDYKQFEADLRQAPDKGAPQATRQMLKKLSQDGRLDPKAYEEAVAETYRIQEMQATTEAKRSQLLKIAKYTALGLGATYAGTNAFKALFE